MDLAVRWLACLREFLLLGPQTALHFRKPLGNSCHIVIGNYIKRLDQDTEAWFCFWDLNHTRFKGLSLIYHRKRLKPLGFPLDHPGMLSNVIFGAGRALLKAYFSWICSLQNVPFAPFTSQGQEAMNRRLTASQGKDTSLGAGNWRTWLYTPWLLWLTAAHDTGSMPQLGSPPVSRSTLMLCP